MTKQIETTFVPRFRNDVKRFWHEESAAVTVDWVVLTASMIGLGIGATLSVSQGARDLAFEIANSLSSAGVAAISFAQDTLPAGMTMTFSPNYFLSGARWFATNLPYHYAENNAPEDLRAGMNGHLETALTYINHGQSHEWLVSDQLDMAQLYGAALLQLGEPIPTELQQAVNQHLAQCVQCPGW